MTLKQLYYLNSAWDCETVLTVMVKTSLYGWCEMVLTFYELPEHVKDAHVECFANARIIVKCEDV